MICEGPRLLRLRIGPLPSVPSFVAQPQRSRRGKPASDSPTAGNSCTLARWKPDPQAPMAAESEPPRQRTLQRSFGRFIAFSTAKTVRI